MTLFIQIVLFLILSGIGMTVLWCTFCYMRDGHFVKTFDIGVRCRVYIGENKHHAVVLEIKGEKIKVKIYDLPTQPVIWVYKQECYPSLLG